MRLVQVTVSQQTVDIITSTLARDDIEHVVIETKDTEPFDAIVSFVLPTQAVEPVLDSLRSAGLTESAQIVVLDTETVISEQADALEEQFETEEKTEDQIARQELHTRASELTPTLPVYVTMTFISAIVATAGLLLNSPAVVVGSMVIAPLIGPALSASVGTVVNDDDLFHDGFQNQVIGVVVSILGAALFAILLRFTLLVPPGENVFLIPEVAERLQPDLLSLFIALGAGVAGILSLTTGISAVLVGVMIAAALIPPAAAAGVALAWGEPVAAIGATVLVLINLVSINVMGLLTLWYSGYRPERFFETSRARRQLLKQVGLYGIAVGALSTFLLASSVTAVRKAAFEEDVEAAVESVLTREEFAQLTLLDFSTAYDERPVLAEPTQVRIEIGTPDGGPHADVGPAIAEKIEIQTGHAVDVRVQFLAITDTQE